MGRPKKKKRQQQLLPAMVRVAPSTFSELGVARRPPTPTSDSGDFSWHEDDSDDYFDKGAQRKSHARMKGDSSVDDEEEEFLEVKDLAKAYKESNVQEITAISKFAARRETAFDTDYSLGDPISILQSHPSYPGFCKRYNTERQKQSPRRGANVLDLFCGVGTGLVVLKRLGIAINHYHFVDHDDSARHVLKHNNCPNHSSTAPIDLINYIEHTDFEDVEQNINTILKHPIDIVIAGPPCQDFSKANAHRQGIQGRTGILLIQTLLLIKTIEKHPKQRGVPVFAMVENVTLDFEDLKATEEAFGCAPVRIDAQYFSPCHRDRHFWVNFPLGNFDFCGPNSKSRPCLEKGWMTIGDALNGGDGYAKTNTFMATKGKLDDHPRMSKVKKNGGRYVRGAYSAQEREWMMGYPDGYVVIPVEEKSAKHLIGNAYSVPVVEFLLRPLVKLFARRAYYRYHFHGDNKHARLYRFKWEDQHDQS